jgi:hypothetical protein
MRHIIATITICIVCSDHVWAQTTASSPPAQSPDESGVPARLQSLEAAVSGLRTASYPQRVTADIAFDRPVASLDSIATAVANGVAQNSRPPGFFEYVRNGGVLIAILGGVIAAIANWNTLFRPKEKRRLEKESEAIEAALIALANPGFQFLYKAELEKGVKLAFLDSLWEPVAKAWSSPFLPDCLRELIKDFTMSYIDRGGWLALLIKQQGADPLQIITLEDRPSMEFHQKAYAELLKALSLGPRKFPFELAAVNKVA